MEITQEYCRVPTILGTLPDEGALDLAGANLGDFSLAKLNIQFTPEFQRIISDAATNALVQDYILCKAIARAGVQGDPEMVAYFMMLTHFLSKERTVSEQKEWRQANPFPKQKENQKSSGQESIDLDDIKVLFECDYKPFVKIIPPEGGPKIEMFFPRSPSIRASYIQDLGIPGQANLFSDPEKNGGRGFVCQITNYEKYPVLNIELDFELRFKEPIYNPGHPVTGGAIKSAIPWTSIIEKVEPNVPFVFYLINASEYFLEADTPDWMYFLRLGEFQTRTARLPTIRGRGTLSFGPQKYPVLPKM